MIGLRFGRLTVVAQAPSRGRKKHWLCLCSCGNSTTVIGRSLRTGATKSCGCFRVEVATKNATKHGHRKMEATSKTYHAWVHMNTRCHNQNIPQYKDWGGRGISICKRWGKFENFLADMGEKPDGMSLDRRDNNGNYTPRNCRWATSMEQGSNTRKSKFVVYKGVRMNISNAARLSEVSASLLSYRIRKGWPGDLLFSPACSNRKRGNGKADKAKTALLLQA
jgi:hypothetical protein